MARASASRPRAPPPLGAAYGRARPPPLTGSAPTVGTQKYRVPSATSVEQAAVLLDHAARGDVVGGAVDARPVDAERGGERQRRGQHGRGVASPPRARAHLVADVAAFAQQLLGEPMPDRHAARGTRRPRPTTASSAGRSRRDRLIRLGAAELGDVAGTPRRAPPTSARSAAT